VTDERVLVGIETSDDAGVYQLNAGTALVQTVDFFSPMTDDPYLFGAIAAANALSDVYAMGGVPLTALNIVCYADCISPAVMGEILRGGADKALEAQVVILGGHTVENADIKYGMAVTGIVHPRAIITNRGLVPGNKLILTKPLGSGIITTAAKAEMAAESHLDLALKVMATLNKAAAEVFSAYKVYGGTDVTGFGLLGHAVELAEGSKVVIHLYTSAIPLLPGVRDYAAMGLVPAGAYNNAAHFGKFVDLDMAVDEVWHDVLYDPQTSGGLLFAVSAAQAAEALCALQSKGVEAREVGEVFAGESPRVMVW